MNIFESRIYQISVMITNYFLLNMLWILFSLPLVTMFPATAAMFAVIRDWQRGNDEGIFRAFFAHFKRNFLNAFLYQIAFSLFIIIFVLDFLLIDELGPFMAQLVFILLISLGILVAFISMYIFPVMVHYDLKFFGMIKQSMLFSIMYFPSTLLSILIFVVMVFIVLFFPFTIPIIFSTTACLIFKICNQKFKKVEALAKEMKEKHS